MPDINPITPNGHDASDPETLRRVQVKICENIAEALEALDVMHQAIHDSDLDAHCVGGMALEVAINQLRHGAKAWFACHAAQAAMGVLLRDLHENPGLPKEVLD